MMFVLCNAEGNCYKVTDSKVKRDQLIREGFRLVQTPAGRKSAGSKKTAVKK